MLSKCICIRRTDRRPHFQSRTKLLGQPKRNPRITFQNRSIVTVTFFVAHYEVGSRCSPYKIAPCDGFCSQAENRSTIESIFSLDFAMRLPKYLPNVAANRRSHAIRSLFDQLLAAEGLRFFVILGNREHLFQTSFTNFSTPDKCLPYLKL